MYLEILLIVGFGFLLLSLWGRYHDCINTRYMHAQILTVIYVISLIHTCKSIQVLGPLLGPVAAFCWLFPPFPHFFFLCNFWTLVFLWSVDFIYIFMSGRLQWTLSFTVLPHKNYLCFCLLNVLWQYVSACLYKLVSLAKKMSIKSPSTYFYFSCLAPVSIVLFPPSIICPIVVHVFISGTIFVTKWMFIKWILSRL